MSVRTLFSLGGLILITAPPAIAQTALGEVEILQRVATNYRQASSTWLEGEIEAVARGPSGERSTKAPFRLALGPGGKVRDELIHPSAGAMRVSNGQQTWLYLAAANQYMRQPAGNEDADLSRGGMAAVLLLTLRTLDQGVESVNLLPEERLLFQGENRPCHVVEVVQEGGATGLAMPKASRRFWIDRDRFVVLKQVTAIGTGMGQRSVEQVETLRYTRVALGQPLPDSLFSFRAPKGAKQVDQIVVPGSGDVDLTGKAATDFTLTDLGGRKHSLRGQRGKVVMLDFWATWCGPCRIQMPMVEKLHHELKDKGLVVYAINQGESAETARRYLTRNKYSTTTLLDPATTVGREYNVAGIPTLVIIDRKGKIAAHYIGVRSEEVLRDALRRAGL
jgi:thiol-disulfide isomerase/thioredoxin